MSRNGRSERDRGRIRIDNRYLVQYIWRMNDVQEVLARLQSKGWTVAAIADDLGLKRVTVARWKIGVHYPANPSIAKQALKQLDMKKRIPKRKRYKQPRKA